MAAGRTPAGLRARLSNTSTEQTREPVALAGYTVVHSCAVLEGGLP